MMLITETVVKEQMDGLLDGAADTSVAHLHPLGDLLAALVHGHGLLDVRCYPAERY